MSTPTSPIRFFHTDHLRLGQAIEGLADAPTWLHQLAGGASRQAVRNMVESAVSQRVDFVLIAGNITAASEDLPAASIWLNAEFETLRRHNIPVVTVSDDASVREHLRTFSSIVLRSTESLAVYSTPGAPRLEECQGHPGNANLLIDVGRPDHSNLPGPIYHAAASQQRSQSTDCVRTDGRLSLSAGVLQAVSNREPGAHGCLMIELDAAGSRLQSSLVACDVLRFSSERIRLNATRFTRDTVHELIERSETYRSHESPTVVADWVIECELTADLAEVCDITEQALLKRLRDELHSGHHGLWLRDLQFADEAVVRPTGAKTAVIDEYMLAHQGPETLTGSSAIVHYHDQGRSTSELVTGLSFLARVA